MDEKISNMVSVINDNWEMRRTYATKLDIKLIEAITKIESLMNTETDKYELELLKVKKEFIANLQNLLLDIRCTMVSSHLVLIEDMNLVFNKAIVPLEYSKNTSHSSSEAELHTTDVLLLFVGMIPVPLASQVACIISAIRLGNAWEEKINSLSKHYEYIKSIFALEWYLDILKEVGINNLTSLKEQRLKEIEKYDLILKPINDGINKISDEQNKS